MWHKQATHSPTPPLHLPPRPPPCKASTIRARESSDRSPSALLAPRIPAPSEQRALCCLKCAVDDLLDVKCREMPEEREGRSVSASAVALDGKRGWGIAATGSNIRNQRGGRAMVGRDTFKVDFLHVGRDIELEKQSTCHSVHSSFLRQVQDENLRGRGVRVSHPSGYSDTFPLRWV